MDLDRGLEASLRTLREDDTESQGWQAMRYMQRYQGHPNLLGFLHVDLESQPLFAISGHPKCEPALAKSLKGRGGRHLNWFNRWFLMAFSLDWQPYMRKAMPMLTFIQTASGWMHKGDLGSTVAVLLDAAR